MSSAPLETILLDDLNGSTAWRNQAAPKITDTKQRGSYNWLTTECSPTIVVPGCPRSVAKWNGGMKLEQSAADHFINENSYRIPCYPMEPLFCAVKICAELSNDYHGSSEGVRFQEFDFVTDRNNLKKLYGFCSGTDDSELYAFQGCDQLRIDVERLGKMIVLIRHDDNDLIPGAEVRGGYGIDFEKKMTKLTDNPLFAGSFRNIVSYKFGNHHMLVRCYVDCVKEPTSAEPIYQVPQQSVQPFALSNSLQYAIGGTLCSGWKSIELTTRYCKNQVPAFLWPYIYFAGNEELMVGWQKNGNVIGEPKAIARHKLYYLYEERFDKPDKTLQRLSDLLSRIKSFVETRRETKFTLLIDKNEPKRINILAGLREFDAVSEQLYEYLKRN